MLVFWSIFGLYEIGSQVGNIEKLVMQNCRGAGEQQIRNCNGSQLKNPDISGAIFKLSLSIRILNSRCVEEFSNPWEFHEYPFSFYIRSGHESNRFLENSSIFCKGAGWVFQKWVWSMPWKLVSKGLKYKI